MHEKEVTQTEIHKGQIEWDRISAHSSFFTWQGSSMEKNQPADPLPFKL